ncbi:MAG: repeat, subgroup [Actinomycetia bacterium]|nr:repeat, subgroup [Actinomycetes bacterium]
MAADGEPPERDNPELIRNGLSILRAAGDTDGLLRTARSILYWAERLELADPGKFDEDLAMFTEPDIKALRCVIRQGENVLRTPSGDWRAKAMALLAAADKYPLLSQIAARGRADLAAAGLGAGELRGLSCQWGPEDYLPSDLFGHKSPVTACRLLADPGRLVTCDQAEMLVWDTGRRALVAMHRNDDPAEVMDACLPRSGAWLCTVQVRGGQGGMNVSNKAALKLWDLQAGGAPRTLAEGTDGPYWLELSPDDRWLVAHHADYVAHFWDTASWERAGVIRGRSRPHVLELATATCYAPDGSWFALADADGGIGLWDPETRTLARRLDRHSSAVAQLVTPDDGSWLASTDGGELCIWDTREGTLLARADASGTGCSGLVADPAGRWAAACFGPDSLRVIPAIRQPGHDRAAHRRTALARRARRLVPRAHGEAFTGATCRTGHDASRILSVSAVEAGDGNTSWVRHILTCWDTATGERVSGPASRPGTLPGVALPRNGEWAALVDEYGLAALSPRTLEVTEFDYSPDRVRSTTISRRSMAAGFESGVVRLYQPDPRDPSGSPAERAPADLAGCFAAPHGRSVIAWSGWRLRQAVVLDPSSGAVRSVLRSENTGVFLNKVINATCHAPDGSWVATADDNGTVRVWDPETGRQQSRAAGLDGEDFLPGPCATAGWMVTTTGGHLWLRDRRGARQREIPVTSRPVSGCAGGEAWLAVEHEASVSIWDPRTGALMGELPGQFAPYRLPLSGDGVPLLACTGPAGQVTITNPVTGKSQAAFSTPAGLNARRADARVRAAAPDMRWLAISDSFGSLRAWHARDGEVRRVSRGYDTPVVACSVTSDGSMLAAADQSGVLRVWDSATWQQIARVRTAGELTGCCWSPEGTHIYAVGRRGAYRYAVPPPPAGDA